MRWFRSRRKPPTQPEPIVIASPMAMDFTLSDLASFTPAGPCILFFRPRVDLTDEQYDATFQMLRLLPMPKDVMPVLVEPKFDLIAVGDAELKQLGLVRLEELARQAKEAKAK